MRILFLDVDGVLNCEEWIHGLTYDVTGETLFRSVDPERVQRLASWLLSQDSPDPLYVVISSSWRKFTDLQEFSHLFKHCGIPALVLGKTPDIHQTLFPRQTHGRGLEIQWWIENAVASFLDEDLEILILDDDADMGFLSDYLVKADFSTGLDSELVIKNPNPWKRYVQPEFSCKNQPNFFVKEFL